MFDVVVNQCDIDVSSPLISKFIGIKVEEKVDISPLAFEAGHSLIEFFCFAKMDYVCRYYMFLINNTIEKHFIIKKNGEMREDERC